MPKLSLTISHSIFKQLSEEYKPHFAKGKTEAQRSWTAQGNVMDDSAPTSSVPFVSLLKFPVLSNGSWQSTRITNSGKGALPKGRGPGQTKTPSLSSDSLIRGPSFFFFFYFFVIMIRKRTQTPDFERMIIFKRVIPTQIQNGVQIKREPLTTWNRTIFEIQTFCGFSSFLKK